MEIYRAVKQAEQQKHNATFSEISKLAIETDALLVERSDQETERENINVFNVNRGGAPQQRFGNYRNNGTKRCYTCGSTTHLARNCPMMYYKEEDKRFCHNCGTEPDFNGYDGVQEENYDNCDIDDHGDEFQHYEEGSYTNDDGQPGNSNYSHGQTLSDNRNQNDEYRNMRRVNTIRFVEQDEQERNQVCDHGNFEPPFESGFY